MARRKKSSAETVGEPAPVTEPVVQATEPPVEAQAAPPAAEEQPKPQYGYGGEIVTLPGGKAHLRDFGNRGGIDVILELPEGEKPAPGVTEPLKEHRNGHTNYQYKGKGHWHKRLTGSGLNPADERGDAISRFREAVKRQNEAETGPSDDGHSR